MIIIHVLHYYHKCDIKLCIMPWASMAWIAGLHWGLASGQSVFSPRINPGISQTRDCAWIDPGIDLGIGYWGLMGFNWDLAGIAADPCPSGYFGHPLNIIFMRIK